jgi:hypothetical protein
MPKLKKSIVLAAGLFGSFVGTAHAQETVFVNVPFPFVVRGEEMPAGRYDVTTAEGVVAIRGLNNRAETVAITLPADGRDPAGRLPALVFVRNGDRYRLSQIWESSEDGFSILAAGSSHSEHTPAASAVAPVVIVANGA